MTDWIDYLTATEIERLEQIKGQKRQLSAEVRRIQDRGRKRGLTERTKVERENSRENHPANPQKSEAL